MRGFRGLAASIAIVASVVCPGASRAETTRELSKRLTPSVLLLQARGHDGETSTGTGFVVSADGRVVTNHHVIEGARDMVAVTNDGREIAVEGVLADGDSENDVAILKLREDKVPPPLTLGDSSAVSVGDDVMVIGCPHGLSQTTNYGKVAAVRRAGLGDTRVRDASGWGMQITAELEPGNSGSPVFASDGEVVGIAVGIAGEAMRFAIFVERAKEMLATIPPNAVPTPFSSSAVARNLAISGGIGLAVIAAYVLSRRLASQKERARLRGRKN